MMSAIRWSECNGKPTCPRCECDAVYGYVSRRLWRCKACTHQFSVTSGTILASRKMSLRDILLAIAIFVNGVKGLAALHLARSIRCQYRSAFVLFHKLRQALAAQFQGAKVSGEVEIDGAYFVGYLKPSNNKKHRRDRRLAKYQNGKRRVVVIARERGGFTLPFIFKAEAMSISTIIKTVVPGSHVYADEAVHWDQLGLHFEMGRINHQEGYSHPEACTNMAESFFSRIRRAEIGTHHHIAGPYIDGYAAEQAWRENNRRASHAELFKLVILAALSSPVSRIWKGYTQRRRSQSGTASHWWV